MEQALTTPSPTRAASGRSLLLPLVARDFKLRYQNSFMGLAWILIEPLLLVATLSGVFLLLERGNREGIPYPLYFYSAVLPWNLFRSALVGGALSFVKDASLLTNFDFAREIILVKNWLVYLVEFAIAFVGYLAILLLYGGHPNLTWLYLFPLLALQAALSIGLMLFVGSLTVFVRDLGIFMGTIATLWFWATPIIFPFPSEGGARILAYFNPMVGMIESYRNILAFDRAPDFASLVPAAVAAVIALAVGLRTFRRVEGRFGDVL